MITNTTKAVIMAVNPEREKVIDKLEEMLEFFRHAEIKNDDSLIKINEQLNDVMSSLKYVPSEPSFDILPTEIKTNILNYLCNSGAFVAASVSQEWKQILGKNLKQLDQVSLGKHCSNRHECEDTQCYMPEEFLKAAVTHNLDVPLSVSHPIRDIDTELIVEGLTTVSNLDISHQFFLTNSEDLFKELEKKGKIMDSLKLTDVDLTDFTHMNYLVNKVKKLTLDVDELFIKTLLQISSDSELICLTLKYYDIMPYSNLYKDFADAVCNVPSVDLLFLPPGREEETAKRFVKNIQTRNIKMKRFELDEDIDWCDVLSPEELKNILEKMDELKLVGHFTAAQIEHTETPTDFESSESDEPSSPPVIEDIEEDDIEYTEDYNVGELVKEQNKNAKYSFGYRIQDEIKDGFIERQEERDGLALRGQYSYSDGYFHHSVTYVADENGYRVTNMVSEPVNNGEGPVENEYGRAIVQTLIGNVKTEYAIQNLKEDVEEQQLGRSEELEDVREELEDDDSLVSSL